MSKIIKYQLIVLFLTILILPFLNDGLNFIHYERKAENRRFRDSLSISISRLDAFPKEAEEYINDNFSFREPLLITFPLIKFYGFNTSPKPEHTIIGQDGWMFMAKHEVDCFMGKEDFSDAQLDSLNVIWRKRKSYFDSKKIKFYWLIPPIKHSVYSSKLPFNIVKSKSISRVEQVEQKLKDGFPQFMIDPLIQLRNSIDKQKVFYKMDNHWNYRAGWIASKQLLSRISKDFPQINSELDIQWKDTVLQTGIHYNVLGIKKLSEVDYVPKITDRSAVEVEKFNFQWPDGFAYFWEYERHFKNPLAKNKLKILVIRDSFGEQMMPFIAEKFSESLFIFDAWKYGLNEEIVETYQPDIVVYVTVENLIESLIRQD